MSKSIKNWELQDSIRECVEEAINDGNGSDYRIWYLDQFLADSWFDIYVKNTDRSEKVYLFLSENSKPELMLAAVDSIAGIGTICHLFEAIIYKKLGGLKRKE